MTYLQLEAIPEPATPGGDTVTPMVTTGYAPVASKTIRMDEQERLGSGVQATRITGLGLAPKTVTVTPSQVGSTPRFVRRRERDIDIALNITAASMTARDTIVAKLDTILTGQALLRMCEPDGNTGISLPASYKYLVVTHVGGGTFTMGDGQTRDTELDLVITLRAHKPDWKTGG